MFAGDIKQAEKQDIIAALRTRCCRVSVLRAGEGKVYVDAGFSKSAGSTFGDEQAKAQTKDETMPPEENRSDACIFQREKREKKLDGSCRRDVAHSPVEYEEHR